MASILKRHALLIYTLSLCASANAQTTVPREYQGPSLASQHETTDKPQPDNPNGPHIVGFKKIGSWVLACSQTPGIKPNEQFQPCRLAFMYTNDIHKVVTVINLRIMKSGLLAVVFAVPPSTAQVGQDVILNLGAGDEIKIPIALCRVPECLAVAALTPHAESDLLASKGDSFQFPNGGQIFAFPVDGIEEAVGALRDANAHPPKE